MDRSFRRDLVTNLEPQTPQYLMHKRRDVIYLAMQQNRDWNDFFKDLGFADPCFLLRHFYLYPFYLANLAGFLSYHHTHVFDRAPT